MSYRFPPKSTREIGLRIIARGCGNARLRAFDEPRVLCFCAEGILVEPDFIASGYEAGEATQRCGWGNKLLGAVVIVGISGAFWTGVGLLINHLVR